MRHLSALELAAWLKADESSADASPNESTRKPLLLDVREPWEYELCHLPGSRLLPMRSVPDRIDELTDAPEIVVVCHHGRRSLQVAQFLERQGFQAIFNLSGGVDAWANDVDPAMRKY
ncbi:MAG TPA: rhodanese-like domain-containing protein [Accumulibacter sp.]|uniref:rhodanese-like domain-containing protein n=1 Tax=Accumulibacter sp. TaxID=2053492 RepID=UPI0025D3D91D|nr:rhodanese-like domain-containing protein [Accumulibacter sp.]MCM8663266.1 rhodanese-like domain-containing protein [Accumulibacter sp.]HNC51310.1 rhodanese-like domain-containing protein [Accumulibacter sp.]